MNKILNLKKQMLKILKEIDLANNFNFIIKSYDLVKIY